MIGKSFFPPMSIVSTIFKIIFDYSVRVGVVVTTPFFAFSNFGFRIRVFRFLFYFRSSLDRPPGIASCIVLTNLVIPFQLGG